MDVEAAAEVLVSSSLMNITTASEDEHWGPPTILISRPALAFTTSVNLVAVLVGTVCNCCVIVTILKTRNLRRSSINRAVLNLCFADLLTIFLDVPLTSAILLGNYFGYQVSLLLNFDTFGK
jgi:hypothetical protein